MYFPCWLAPARCSTNSTRRGIHSFLSQSVIVPFELFKISLNTTKIKPFQSFLLLLRSGFELTVGTLQPAPLFHSLCNTRESLVDGCE